MRKNLQTFHGTLADENPQGFLHEVLKVLDAMGVTARELAELASYRLKVMGQVWFYQWRDEIPIRADLVDQ